MGNSKEETRKTFVDHVLPAECAAIRRRRQVLVDGPSPLSGRVAPGADLEVGPRADDGSTKVDPRLDEGLSTIDPGADEAPPERSPLDEAQELATAGLALSGGGIRSATFGLGVLQALDRQGLFRGFDYISTVSGGGFIGSALSAWFARRRRSGGEDLGVDPAEGEEGPTGDERDFPFRTTSGGESAELIRLRNHSRYLSTSGPLSAFLLPVHLVRGFLFNLVLLLPWLMAAAWLTVQFERWAWSWPLVSRAFVGLAFAAFLVTVVGYTRTFDPRNRERWQSGMLIAFAVLAGAVLLFVIGRVVDSAFTATAMLLQLETSLIGLAGWFFAGGGWKQLAGGAAVVGFALLAPLPGWLGALRGKLVLVAASLLVPAALFVLYIALCVWAGVLSSRMPIELDPPVQDLASYDTIERGEGQSWVIAVSQDTPPAGADKTGKRPLVARIDDEREVVISRQTESTGDGALEVVARSTTLTRLDEVTDRRLLPVKRYVQVYAAKPGETEYLVDRVPVAATGGGEVEGEGGEAEGAGEGSGEEAEGTGAGDGEEAEGTGEGDGEEADGGGEGVEGDAQPADGRLSIELENGRLFLRVASGLAVLDEPVRKKSYFLVGFAAALLLLIFGSSADPNLLSWHGFYRDRIAHAYDLGEVKLSRLYTEEAGGPYPLINTALNAPASEDPAMRRRGVGFFLFSPRFVGSERAGYCPTKEFEELDPNLRLSSAVAISAAAASPIMGTYTLWPLVFSLTMLNLRLNYWAPNPGHESRYGAVVRHGANPWYLVREATGRVGTTSAKVNLSDGGHVENLGVHELLRRRCRFIVAVDGEEDSELGFGSLAALIRYARIDLQTEIHIDLSRLARKKRWSRRHWALGTIEYPGGGRGHLLYVKASLTDDEGADVLSYARGTAFPHESTANQSFSETQFEAYRALGEHIGLAVGTELRRGDEAAAGPLLEALRGPTPGDGRDGGDRHARA